MINYINENIKSFNDRNEMNCKKILHGVIIK